MKGTPILLTTALLFAACAPMEPALPSSDEVRTAIEARNARFMEAFNAKDAAALAECYTADAAIERGTYVAQVMLPGAEEGVEDSGSYVVYWKKGTDGWRLHWDIWNTDLALPAPEIEQGEQ